MADFGEPWQQWPGPGIALESVRENGAALFKREADRDRAIVCVNFCAGVDSETLARIAKASPDGGLEALLSDARANARVWHGVKGHAGNLESCAAPTCVRSRALLGLP